MKLTIFVFSAVLCFFLSPSLSALTIYSELQMRDFDEMHKEVQKRISKARAISASASSELEKLEEDAEEDPSIQESDKEAINILRETMLFILSRPDKDNVVAKLFPLVRRELNNYNAYDDAVHGIVTEAISGLRQKKLKVTHRATYVVVLENVMAELRPEINLSPSTESIFKKIMEADIEIPSDVRNELKLRSMETVGSPSEIAKETLEKAKKAKQKNKKKD